MERGYRSGVDDAVEEELHVTLPVANGSPAEARHLLDVRMRLPDDPAQKARLLVSELVTYRLRHGGLDLDAVIDLTVSRGADRLRVEIHDDGTAYDPPVSADVADGEWALAIIDGLSDGWGMDTGRSTTIWFELVL
jgi:anti-sigma regulatory factor (Ser/Thr protein kinase)